MDLLARREHSLAELRDKLAARGFAPVDIDDAVAALGREGLADDTRFVEAFVAARIRRGQGPLRIRAELAERGIAAETVARCLAAACDWRRLAREVRVKRFGAGLPQEFRERARQARFLEQRGFAGAEVRAALEGDDE
jgi:regulatory protein